MKYGHGHQVLKCSSQIQRNNAADTKTRVQSSVISQARHERIITIFSGENNAAVSLNSDTNALIARRRGQGCHSTSPKPGIYRAIGIKSGNKDIVIQFTRNQYFAVRCLGHRLNVAKRRIVRIATDTKTSIDTATSVQLQQHRIKCIVVRRDNHATVVQQQRTLRLSRTESTGCVYSLSRQFIAGPIVDRVYSNTDRVRCFNPLCNQCAYLCSTQCPSVHASLINLAAQLPATGLVAMRPNDRVGILRIVHGLRQRSHA